MAELRQRKPVPTSPSSPTGKSPEEDAPKPSPPDLNPSLSVMVTLLVSAVSFIALLFTYKESHAANGAFASFINTRFPAIPAYLHPSSSSSSSSRASNPFGVSAESTPPIHLTEADLLAYDGTDPDKPILLAINGTIFDVSASPSFYGPGGHYHHFVGRDASRAWVTECWASPEQLTWRMDGIEDMFMPKWIDEQLESAADGTLDTSVMGDSKMIPIDMIAKMAKKAMEKFGTVSEEEREERRITDAVEAKEKVEETLAHWVQFFAGNDKYKKVGTVELDQTKPAPPKICNEAMQKRPIKGGKLEPMMGSIGGLFGGAKKGGQGEEKMPEFVKQKLAEAKGEDVKHEEL